MTPALYLVHHGETEWNRAHRYQGRLDSPLTAEGRSQARRVAALLAREPRARRPIRLATSPLGRAVETAGIVGATLGLEPAGDARLVEVALGRWEGLTVADIDAQFPGALDGTSRWDWYFRAPGGESFDAVAQRLASWLGDVAEPTIAVGHGVAWRILRGLYAGLPREEALRQPTRRDGVFKLEGGQITFLEAADSL